MKQVKFKDKENDVILGGILLDDGDLVCACCGGLIPADELVTGEQFEIIEVYETWIDFSQFIIDE